MYINVPYSEQTVYLNLKKKKKILKNLLCNGKVLRMLKVLNGTIEADKELYIQECGLWLFVH